MFVLKALGPSKSSVFFQALEHEMHSLNSMGLSSNVEIYFDIVPHDLIQLLRRAFLEKFPSLGLERTYRILLRFEPKVVLPITYTPFMSTFDQVIDFGFRQNSAFPWPQLEESITPKKPKAHRSSKKVCMISANKMSLLKGELYSLRKQIALKISDIDLYGRDWGKISKFQKIGILFRTFIFSLPSLSDIQFESAKTWLLSDPHSLGSPDSKFEIYKKYRIALVIENEASYVSEKLFDALVAGCIPIYVGPRNSFIDSIGNLVVFSEPSINAVKEAIKFAESIDYESWLRKANDFFYTHNLDEHSILRVAKETSRVIYEKVSALSKSF